MLRVPRRWAIQLSGASTTLLENIVVRVKWWAVLLRPPGSWGWAPGGATRRPLDRRGRLLDDEETDNGGAAGAVGVEQLRAPALRRAPQARARTWHWCAMT